MDPLTALATFNASYAVVKTAAQNAGEISEIFAGIGKMLSAKQAIEKATPEDADKSDLELYAAKVEVDQKWDEVKQILVWSGHWDGYQKFVQDRREAEKRVRIKALREHQAKMKKVKEGFMIAAVIISVLSAVGIFFWLIWLMKNKGGL